MALLNNGSVYIGSIGPEIYGGSGPSLVNRFLSEGWTVFAGYHKSAANEILNITASVDPGRCKAFEVDHADYAAVNDTVVKISETISALDLFIFCSDISETPPEQEFYSSSTWDQAAQEYDRLALGMLRSVEAFLPLMDNGRLKRLCFVSPGSASIQSGTKDNGFVRNMSASALHCGAAILFNRLRPQGYTFRMLLSFPDCPPVSDFAYQYFLHDRSYEPGNRLHSDEDRFTVKDTLGRERAW